MANDFDAVTITERPGPPPSVRFAVRVQPRSSRTGIDGARGDAIRVRVNAPPVDGAANEAVVAVLAKALGLSKRDITIVSGGTSRAKIIEVSGVSSFELRTRLAP